MASSKGKVVKRSADLLLNDDDTTGRKKSGKASGLRNRPAPLQGVIDIIGNIMLSHDAPMMAKFAAGKVLHEFVRSGTIKSPPQTATLTMGEEFDRAIFTLSKAGHPYSELAQKFVALSPDLDWRTGRSGPFASVNFERAHSNAVIAGPGGLEERGDIRLGVTLMAPYSRFPDHVQYHSRVFLLLSEGEFRFAEQDWVKAQIGTILFNEAGSKIAMRCTADPLFAVWCHVERATQ